MMRNFENTQKELDKLCKKYEKLGVELSIHTFGCYEVIFQHDNRLDVLYVKGTNSCEVTQFSTDNAIRYFEDVIFLKNSDIEYLVDAIDDILALTLENYGDLL